MTHRPENYLFSGFPTPPDRGPFIKEVTGHYLTLSWIPTKRSPPRYPQVTYVIEIRELPEKEWTLVSSTFVSSFQALMNDYLKHNSFEHRNKKFSTNIFEF